MPGGRIPHTGWRFRTSRLRTPGQWRALQDRERVPHLAQVPVVEGEDDRLRRQLRRSAPRVEDPLQRDGVIPVRGEPRHLAREVRARHIELRVGSVRGCRGDHVVHQDRHRLEPVPAPAGKASTSAAPARREEHAHAVDARRARPRTAASSRAGAAAGRSRRPARTPRAGSGRARGRSSRRRRRSGGRSSRRRRPRRRPTAPRDRPAGLNRPAHAAAPGRDAVEEAVVRAEEDAPGPHRRRRVDVAPRVSAPEGAAAGRERGQRAAVGGGHEDTAAPDRGRPVDPAVHAGRPAQRPFPGASASSRPP